MNLERWVNVQKEKGETGSLDPSPSLPAARLLAWNRLDQTSATG